ncbi:hypothetical protein Plhal710r2_c051g0158191 [Plasmopara halstedii]
MEVSLVVDLTSTHLYLLTNLQPWVDDTFTYHLSFDFTKEIKRYRRRHPRMKRSGRKRNVTNVKDADVAKQPRRKSTRTAAMKSSAKLDKTQVVVEQLFLDRPKPEEVHRFSLDSDICWCSSAAFDFAIFKVSLPRDNKLDRCTMSTNLLIMLMPSFQLESQVGAETKWFSPLCQLLVYLEARLCAQKNEQYQIYGYTFHGVLLELPSSLPPDT